MSMRLADKCAIVTGAGSGFGAGIARLFCAQGAKVLLADINLAAAEAVAAEITTTGGHAVACEVDVSINTQVKAMVATCVETFGDLNILVNNAGITHKNQPMLDVDEASFDKIFAVNVKSVSLSAVHGVPIMRANGSGVIINIASTAGVRPRPGLTWYNSSKGAMITMTKSMAIELATDGIRVLAVNPVAGDTPLLKQFLPAEDSPEIRQKFIDTIPLGRLSQPEDIAKACLFFASDEAGFLTGVCMEVDGGRCI